MRSTLLGILLVISTSATFAQTNSQKGRIVPNWSRTGNDPKGDYVVAADTNAVHSGKSSVTIRCDTCTATPIPDNTSEFNQHFASLVQGIRADAFRGKRIEFSAYLKSESVQGDGAGLWLRIDGPNMEPLGLDNMSEPDRMVHGTTNWKRYSVVLDVPERAVGIAMGVMLSGKGQMWIDDASLQVVGKNVPVAVDMKKFNDELQKETAQLTPEQRAQVQADAQRYMERVKTYPTQLQNPGFEQQP